MGAEVKSIDIGTLRAGDKVTRVVGLLMDVNLREYGSGVKKAFMVGTLTDGKEKIAIKYWDDVRSRELVSSNIAGKVVIVSGEAELYRGNKEFKITEIIADDSLQTSENKSLFLPEVDDREGKYKEFLAIANKELSQSGLKVLTGVMTSERLKRYKEEMAGTKMHDAKVGGLMNHTLKMLKYSQLLLEMEPRVREVEHMKDLLLLGVILHDLGKIKEYEMGTRAENSFVTHRVFGMEYIHEMKAEIISLYDEKFYYQLQDVIIGHHGEYGNAPTTVVAYIIHLIDMLDSQTTGIFDRIENGEVKLQGGSSVVYGGGSNLVI